MRIRLITQRIATIRNLRLLILIFILIASTYYIFRMKQMLGFKRYVEFNVTQCIEPLLFLSRSKTKETAQIPSEWETHTNKDIGYSIYIPNDWIVKNTDCMSAYGECVYSPKSEVHPTSIFPPSLYVTGGRLDIRRFDKNYDFEKLSWDIIPHNFLDFLKIQCDYYKLNNLKAVERRRTHKKGHRDIFIDAGKYVYVLDLEIGPEDNESLEIFQKIISSFTYIGIEERPNIEVAPYSGKPWQSVPYQGLNFIEIDIYNLKQRAGELEDLDYHQDNLPLDGYTFVAYEGDGLNFIVDELRWLTPKNELSVRTELYGYGPTVVRGDSRIGWKVPVTGRYFWVIKSSGTNDIYGKYELTIEKQQ